jgi:hypothetical protein
VCSIAVGGENAVHPSAREEEGESSGSEAEKKKNYETYVVPESRCSSL